MAGQEKSRRKIGGETLRKESTGKPEKERGGSEETEGEKETKQG